MRFTNRETQFPGKKRITKVDANNVPLPNEQPILVRIEKDEGAVYANGTPIDAEALNKGNWRDDDNISFKNLPNDDLPAAKASETQFVAKSNGEVWVIPPLGLGDAIDIAKAVGTIVRTNGDRQDEISFTSDPQTQINDKSTVRINNVRTDVNFISDPQIQISGKASRNDLEALSQRVSDTQNVLGGKQDVNLTFSDVSPFWSTEGGSADYPYRGTIACVGSTDAMLPIVIFGETEAHSGNYDSIAESGTDAVYVWGKVDTAIIIPKVVVMK